IGVPRSLIAYMAISIDPRGPITLRRSFLALALSPHGPNSGQICKGCLRASILKPVDWRSWPCWDTCCWAKFRRPKWLCESVSPSRAGAHASLRFVRMTPLLSQYKTTSAPNEF
ncbi:unnamed protein product, partial [Mycena citricolor]